MDSSEGNTQGRRKKRGVYRDLDSVTTAASKTPRIVCQKGDKGIAESDGKQRRGKPEKCKQGEENKQGEEFICSVCLESANTDVVECGKCQKWYHITCVSLEDVRHELHEMEWACEACTRVENTSDDDVFVDSMGDPARRARQNSDLVQNSGITIPQPAVTASPCMTGQMDEGRACTEPESGQVEVWEHAPTMHDGISVLESTDACNTHDNTCQPPMERSTREPRRPQERISGTSGGNHETQGATFNSAMEDMLMFTTCKDLETKLEARQIGSSVHSNSTEPKLCKIQTPSVEDKGIACIPDSCLETEAGYQNRYELQIPQDTVGVFLGLAEQNTNQNIETLGILAGNIVPPNICVTHLVVPRQKGDSTTCECLEEELVVETLQENEVVQVGWIHTHPSHSTFLSSIDVHTQYSLQSDIPGAVAIVHSHRDGQTGHFRLTERGMRDVANCQVDGFHEGCARAENWGTVQTLPSRDPENIKAIDLRRVQSKQEQIEKTKDIMQKRDDSKADGGRACEVIVEVTQGENSGSAENERQEEPIPDVGGSSTIEQTSKEDNCLPSQVLQQEACSVTAKSKQVEENNDARNRKEQMGGKDQKQKRQRKARTDVQMSDVLAENQALRVEIQQLRTQLGDVGQQAVGTTNIPHRISGQPLCAACCGYLMWLHKQYQAESKIVAQDEHAQHIKEGPGQTQPRTAGQVQQSMEQRHQGAGKTQGEAEAHYNDAQGTNVNEQEPSNNHQENDATERAGLSKDGREANLLEYVAPTSRVMETDRAGAQEISIVREQRTIGTQTCNNGDMQRQQGNQRWMDQDEHVRSISSRRPDQRKRGELIWEEHPGPRSHMRQNRYTGSQYLPRWERNGRQTQGQEKETYLAKEGSNRLQGQHGEKSKRPAQRVRVQDTEGSVQGTWNGHSGGGTTRARHGIKRYQTTIIYNSKYQQHHLARGGYHREKQDSREVPPVEYRRQRATLQEDARDRNRVLDDDMPSEMMNEEEYQDHGDKARYQKPHASSGYWAQNRFTGTLNTNRKADLEHQQRTDWRRKWRSQDGGCIRQYSDYMNMGYQNWGRRLRRQDLSGYTPAGHGRLDMAGEEHTQELGPGEWADNVGPQDASRSGAGSQSQSADVGKGEGAQVQDSTAWRPQHYMISEQQEETRRVRFQEIGAHVRGQEQCSTSSMHDESERLQTLMHNNHMPSPRPQEDEGQVYTRNSDQGGAIRTASGQDVGRDPWQQTKMTGSQNSSRVPGPETEAKRVAWLDKVVAAEGFLRGNGGLETIV